MKLQVYRCEEVFKYQYPQILDVITKYIDHQFWELQYSFLDRD